MYFILLQSLCLLCLVGYSLSVGVGNIDTQPVFKLRKFKLAGIQFAVDKNHLIDDFQLFQQESLNSGSPNHYHKTQTDTTMRRALFRKTFSVSVFAYNNNIGFLDNLEADTNSAELMFEQVLQVYLHPMPFLDDNRNSYFHIKPNCLFFARDWIKTDFSMVVGK